MLSSLCCLLFVVGVPPGEKHDRSGKTGMVDYARNVRIDWNRRHVELGGVVVLREGALELFACTPNTREHESIVAIDARPLKIHEALGLIGLTPGHPVRYDKVSDRWIPADGERVKIEAQWRHRDKTRTTDIGTWMEVVATGEPVPPNVWRFAGSGRTEDGRFLADIDEPTLQAVADLTGGSYFRAEGADQLYEIFLDLPAQIVLQKETLEISVVFTALGAIFALISIGLSLRWNRIG